MSPISSRTFKRLAPRKLSEAYGHHATLKAAADAMHKGTGLLVDDLEPMWAVIRGEDASAQGVPGMLAQAVRWTMPMEGETLLAHDEVAAVFAFECIAERLAALPNLKSDLVVRRACIEAWDEWENRRMAANAVQEGFGCDESAAWHTLRDTADHPDVEAKMRAIAELAGAMFKSMSTIAKRVPTEDPHKVTGVEKGGDLDRLLPQEIARLAVPEFADQQAMAILGRQAHQRKFAGTRTMGRGPLVIAIDESGSMHDEDRRYRGRNTWAKACAVALTRIAHGDGRHVRCVHWSHATAVQDVPVGDHRAMWEMAHSFMSGGTSMELAVRTSHAAAMELRAEGVQGADVVLISDGQAPLTEAVIEAMKADGIELWSVAIGDNWPKEFPARKLAAKYVYAHDRDLSKKKLAVELAEGLSEAARAREN